MGAWSPPHSKSLKVYQVHVCGSSSTPYIRMYVDRILPPCTLHAHMHANFDPMTFDPTLWTSPCVVIGKESTMVSSSGTQWPGRTSLSSCNSDAPPPCTRARSCGRVEVSAGFVGGFSGVRMMYPFSMVLLRKPPDKGAGLGCSTQEDT